MSVLPQLAIQSILNERHRLNKRFRRWPHSTAGLDELFSLDTVASGPTLRSHFYRSLRDGADILEASVIRWADANPF
jgi:hypothetical protein